MMLTSLFLFSQNGLTPKLIEGVEIEGEFPHFIDNAILPYANYVFSNNNNDSKEKVALFIEQFNSTKSEFYKSLMPECILDSIASDSIFFITLTNTRHLKGCPLWFFAPKYYTILDNVKIFISGNVTNLDLKKSKAIPGFIIREPERLYEYDPQVVTVYKKDGKYSFHITRPFIEMIAHSDGKPTPRDKCKLDSVCLPIVEPKIEFSGANESEISDNLVYFIDSIDTTGINLSIRPQFWIDKNTLLNYCLIKASPNDSTESNNVVSNVYIKKSIASTLDMTVVGKISVTLPSTIPSFVKYVDFPTLYYKMKLRRKT